MLRYLFFCVVTVIFLSFGAPFWHRLSESLLRSRGIAPGVDRRKPTPEED